MANKISENRRKRTRIGRVFNWLRSKLSCLCAKSHRQETSDCLSVVSPIRETSDCLSAKSHLQETSDGLSAKSHLQEMSDCLSAKSHRQETSDGLSAKSHHQETSDCLSAKSHPQETSDCLSAKSHPQETSDCLSAKSHRQETSVESTANKSPTIPLRDFKDQVPIDLQHEEFYPNPRSSETKCHEATSPEEEEISLQSCQENGLLGEEINTVCSTLGIRIKGCMPKDQIRSGLELGSYLTYELNKEGHCTALYVTEQHYEYYDSGGQQLHDIEGVNVISNDIQYQQDGSKTCGLHALYCLKQREELGSFAKVMNSYPTDRKELLDQNDEHVYNHTLKKYYRQINSSRRGKLKICVSKTALPTKMANLGEVHSC